MLTRIGYIVATDDNKYICGNSSYIYISDNFQNAKIFSKIGHAKCSKTYWNLKAYPSKFKVKQVNIELK